MTDSGWVEDEDILRVLREERMVDGSKGLDADSVRFHLGMTIWQIVIRLTALVNEGRVMRTLDDGWGVYRYFAVDDEHLDEDPSGRCDVYGSLE